LLSNLYLEDLGLYLDVKVVYLECSKTKHSKHVLKNWIRFQRKNDIKVSKVNALLLAAFGEDFWPERFTENERSYQHRGLTLLALIVLPTCLH